MNNIFKEKVKETSFILSIHPSFKIIFILLFSFSIFFAPNETTLILILITLIVFSFFAKVKFSVYWNTLKFILISFPILLIINLFVIRTGQEIFIWSIPIYLDSISLTIEITTRIFILIFFSSIMLLSSPEHEINDGIKILLLPLKKIKIPIDDISIIISIGLRYVPILVNDFNTIIKAQASRGLDFKVVGIIKKIKILFNTLNPLFINSFIRANQMSYSMMNRGYESKTTKSMYMKYKISYLDFINLIFVLIIFSFSVFMIFDNGNIIPLIFDISYFS